MQWSIKMADTIMKRYPDPDSFPYKSWTYSQGFMLWGMIELFKYTNDKKYYDYVMSYAETHVNDEGGLLRFNANCMDDMMAGAVLVWAYAETKQKKYKTACDTIRKSFDDYPRNSDGGYWHSKRLPYEMWVDGVFMGQMFLTKYGHFIGDADYCFDEAAKQLKVIYDHCCKGDTGLILHGFSEDKQAKWADKETGLSPEVWSEGLGWYALVLPEVLELMPKTHPDRERIIRQYTELMQSLKKHQSAENGLWYQVVDKGDRPDNWTDSSGSAMFAYSIQKGIELGFANAEEFAPVVEKAYKGLIENTKINEEGLLDLYEACDGLCVQTDYDVYINYKKKVNAKEAVAAFLWATGIIEKPNGIMREPKLFALLPDYVCTPDGMAIDSDGRLILSCPNFANDDISGCVLRIDQDGRIEKWFDVPVSEETGISRPMGIAFGPDGDLYICDNQGWSGKPELRNKGRILRVRVTDGTAQATVVAHGMEHPNGIRIRGDYMYVTQSTLEQAKDTSGLLVSCVYRFGLDEKDIAVTNTLEDKHILTTFITYNKDCQYGADGIEFDEAGNLYVGNFGDGAVYRIVFGADGEVMENKVFAQDAEQLQTTDGIVRDNAGNLYVADFSANAIAKIDKDGNIERIAQSPDCDGFDGGLDQPGEPIVWQGKLIISCFDLVTGPDKVNTKHEIPATLSMLDL